MASVKIKLRSDNAEPHTLHVILQDDQVKEDRRVKTCRMHRGDEIYETLWLNNLN